MNQFWWFVSFFISVTGFMVVAGTSVLAGEDLFYAAIKSIGAFVVLWFVQSLLRGLLAIAADSAQAKDSSVEE
jgi:hypothetical protein